jgi:hypothetical protein
MFVVLACQPQHRTRSAPQQVAGIGGVLNCSAMPAMGMYDSSINR